MLKKEQFVVERIIGVRKNSKKKQYLVKWVGFQKPTWQPISNQSLTDIFEIYDMMMDGDIPSIPVLFTIKSPLIELKMINKQVSILLNEKQIDPTNVPTKFRGNVLDQYERLFNL